MIHVGWSVVMAVLTLQAAPPSPARIGDSARKLSQQDVAGMERAIASATGKPWNPWLLIGGKDPKGNFRVYAYLPEEQKTAGVRRSKKVLLNQPSNRAPWTMWVIDEKSGGDCAQVAIPGRSLDSILADRDNNQPFEVYGEFQDAELISIVTFVRSNPRTPIWLERIPYNSQIKQVSRTPDGFVGVSFKDANEYSWVSVILKGGIDNWTVDQISHLVS